MSSERTKHRSAAADRGLYLREQSPPEIQVDCSRNQEPATGDYCFDLRLRCKLVVKPDDDLCLRIAGSDPGHSLLLEQGDLQACSAGDTGKSLHVIREAPIFVNICACHPKVGLSQADSGCGGVSDAQRPFASGDRRDTRRRRASAARSNRQIWHWSDDSRPCGVAARDYGASEIGALAPRD